MRFLVNEDLSTLVVKVLVDAGHDALHVAGAGLAWCPDEHVLARAANGLSGDVPQGTSKPRPVALAGVSRDARDSTVSVCGGAARSHR